MPLINILSQDYQSISSDQNQSKLINMYLEEDKMEGKYPLIALPTPGLTLVTTIASPVRGLFEEHDILYAVGGNKVYKIASDGTATNIGALTTSTGPVQISGINESIMFTDGAGGYLWDINTQTFNPILTQLSGGIVASVQVTAVGTNYTNAVTVQFSGGGGSGATGIVQLSGNQVVAVIVTNGGSGYNSAPTVSFSDSGGGTGATAAATITTNAFPNTTLSTTAQDEFYIATVPNSQTWQISSISDGSSWQPLNFASVTGNQNNLVGCMSLQRQIWLFSENTTEIWYNAGNVNFPFLRRPDVYVEYGCAAVNSLAKGDNTLWFLGQAPSGGPVVIRMDGYSPRIISTRALNYILQTYSVVSDAVGFVYQQNGHLFYVLTFPTQGVTWVYDQTTDSWHERTSLVNGVYTRWLPSCYAFCYNMPLVGDFNSGNIYKLDLANYTENGVAINRVLQTHPFYTGDYTIFDRLQLDMDTTPGASLSQVNLSVSRLTSQPSFGTPKPAIPQDGAYGWRVYWNSLGIGRVFVFMIQTTMNAKFCILGAMANVRTGGILKGNAQGPGNGT